MANEKRLIDANALNALENLDYDYAPMRDGCAWYRAADVWACIEREPTVDAVEVVRCKDCKHRENLLGELCCPYYEDLPVEDDHFCAYGERR